MDDKDLDAYENPYCPPNASPPGPVKMAGEKDQRSAGCLVLFLLALPVVDSFGVLLSIAPPPYRPVIVVLFLVGFACGAVLGAYVSVNIKRRPWWSSCRWAICGLIGSSLAMVTIWFFFRQQ